MPSFNPDVNPITQATDDLRPLFQAAPIEMFEDNVITIYDYFAEDNRGYPFVTLGLGTRDPDGSVTVQVNCHVAPEGAPGVHELGAEVERKVRDILDDTSHSLIWQRSSPLVKMRGHATVTVFADYPKWRK